MSKEHYDNWMDNLQYRPVGDIRHNVIPQWIAPELAGNIGNTVWVSYEEHFYMHKLLFEIHQDVSSIAAWLAVWGQSKDHMKAKESDLKLLFDSFTELMCEYRDENDLWPSLGPHSEEALQKMRDGHANFYANGGVNGFQDKKHSDETRKLLSELKTKLFKDEPERKERLSDILMGHPGTPHTDKHREYISELHTGEGNPMFGVGVWDNPAAQSNECQEAYSLLPRLYDFYHARKFKKRGWGAKAFATYIHWPHKIGSLQTGLDWIREYGDPRENNEWIAFNSAYKKIHKTRSV